MKIIVIRRKMSLLIAVTFFSVLFSSTVAFDPLDPNGNITIKWDVVNWTPDGYVAKVTIFNFQQYRQIQAPGWTLGWTWAKKEVIWAMVGAEATEQGDCSKFKGNNIPHCCKNTPTVVDLLPGVPYNQQFSNCCKGGVLAAWGQDPQAAVSSFQVSVGQAGTSDETIKLPKTFTLVGPGPGYTCGPATVVPPTKFLSPDRRRKTQALMTWTVTCTYSQFLAQKVPTCCVSLSSFYSDKIVPCPTCACGCQDNITHPGSCVDPTSPYIASAVTGRQQTSSFAPLVECTPHMCPIRVNWHVKVNYKGYWRVKIAVTNYNYMMNYSNWILVVQHPNLNKLAQIFSFNYKPLPPYDINDTGIFFGVKFYNELLMQAGKLGNVRSDVLFRKDENFMLEDGWAFPRRIYFNGDECQMPDSYPLLPNTAPVDRPIAKIIILSAVLFALVIMLYRILYRRYKKRY